MIYLPLAFTFLAAVIDARTGRIPNWLTFPALVTGLATNGVLGGLEGSLWAIVGALLCGVIPWVLFRSTQGQGIGGGDVKLFAALGAWLGTLRGLEVEMSAFLVLAFLALVQLTYRGELLRVLMNVATLLINPFRRRAKRRSIEPAALTEMRMGPAIFIATVAGVSPLFS